MKETTRWKMGQIIYTSPKAVTWKSVIATSFKTPHKCVGHSVARIRQLPTDRPMGRQIGRKSDGARIRGIPMDRPMDRRIGRTTYS